MDNLILASTAFDLVAVAVLAWLVLRSGREREAGFGVQRAALESLRADLSQLVLAAREHRLQELLEQIARVEAPRRELRRGSLVEDEEDPRDRRRAADEDDARRRSAADDDRDLRERRRPAVDPAEARLLRDLQLTIGARRA
jgi:hypothetical protein